MLHPFIWTSGKHEHADKDGYGEGTDEAFVLVFSEHATDLSRAMLLVIRFQEYVLDKMETEKRARTQLESGSALTSRTALTDRREKGSMKGSTTQLKSPSKVSRKSQMMS